MKSFSWLIALGWFCALSRMSLPAVAAPEETSEEKGAAAKDNLQPTLSSSCVTKIEGAALTTLLKAVEDSYASLSLLQAKFKQRSYFTGADEVVESEGRVLFKRPGKLRMVYELPDKQEFVADGKQVWFYEPELTQVTLFPFKEAFTSEIPISFLLGIGSLSKAFEPVSGCQRPNRREVELRARKAEKGVQRLTIYIDPVGSAEPRLLGAKVIDVADNYNEFIFVDRDFKSEVSDKEFEFSVPKGVDVIDKRLNTETKESTVPVRKSDIHEQDIHEQDIE